MQLTPSILSNIFKKRKYMETTLSFRNSCNRNPQMKLNLPKINKENVDP
jgi:hypothetical protein